MCIIQELKKDLFDCLEENHIPNHIWSKIRVEIPKDPLNGDISTNIALELAKHTNNIDSRELALNIKDNFKRIPYIAHVETAKMGFINFTIKSYKWQAYLQKILDQDKSFLSPMIGNHEKVNVEFVSANPTGPMHIGHARGAVIGDVLVNLLRECGYDVLREFYINDAGSQVDMLTESIIVRYEERCGNKNINLENIQYAGEYLKDVANDLYEEYGATLNDMPQKKRFNLIKSFAIEKMLNLIKKDLTLLGVKHDHFFSESSLHKENKITEAIEILKSYNLIAYEEIDAPLGKKSATTCNKKEQLVFKSTLYKDDKDRPLQKDDGSWSYFASDIAYIKNKIDRGFDYLVYILGADHIGYVKRISAAIKALGKDKIQSNILLSQIVNFIQDGKALKMSKRNNNIITVNDVVKEVGKDAVRFMMISRNSDTILDFDFTQVKKQSNDNPVFYVQYAFVRTNSVINKAKIKNKEAYSLFIESRYDLSLLSTDQDIEIIKTLSIWPETIKNAARTHAPQKIARYLVLLSDKFHKLWSSVNQNDKYNFIVENNPALTAARLALVQGVRNILKKGFDLIKITPPESM